MIPQAATGLLTLWAVPRERPGNAPCPVPDGHGSPLGRKHRLNQHAPSPGCCRNRG